MRFLLFLVLALAVVLWVISVYNTLVRLKHQVYNGWKQIDVQLKRRHDLVPNLVESVRGAMQFERDTLEAVVAARNKAIAVEHEGAGIARTAAAESQLTAALGRLLAVVEAYPDLKATGNVAQLQEELTSTENRIAFARQFYNDAVLQYNTARETLPTSLFAGALGFQPAEMFALEDPGQRATPQVRI